MINNKKKLTEHEIGFFLYDEALCPKDTRQGIINAIKFINDFYKSEETIIYRLDENGNYINILNNNQETFDNNISTIILNKEKDYVNNNYVFIEIEENKKICFIPVKSKESKKEYVISISNPNTHIEKENDSIIEIIKHCISVILKDYEAYEELLISATEDILTGLYNRNKFIEYMNILENSKDKFVFAIFDLFRLKYVNDEYDHKVGDDYIIKAGEILKKYFPKYNYEKNQDGSLRKKETGNILFKIGGDEFVVISKMDNIETIESKSRMVQEEVKNIKLGVENQLALGLNYGVAERQNNQTPNDVYKEADEKMKEDKAALYKALGLERRRQTKK